MALAQQGEILAHVAMPIAGMLSDLPAAESPCLKAGVSCARRRHQLLPRLA